MRPPTPSQLHATARNVTAATSRQSAPSVSRILGTDAPRSRGASRSAGRDARRWPGAGYGATSVRSEPALREAARTAPAPGRAGPPGCRRVASSWSARCSVREELDRRGPGQGEGAAPADLGSLGEQGVAVGAARRIGVRRHESEYLMLAEYACLRRGTQVRLSIRAQVRVSAERRET